MGTVLFRGEEIRVETGTKRMIQATLLIAMLLAGLRVYMTFRSRTGTDWGKKPDAQSAPMNADYYVTPKKLHAHDLKSAREITQQPAWVREGYRYQYYPYSKHSDFKHPAGLLGPIEKLQFTDLAVEKSPDAPNRQLMAIFEKGGKKYSVPIGMVTGDSYEIYADEMFYIQDPRELYKHWSKDTWQAIDAREIKPGMNELQASFAAGVGLLESGSRTDERVLKYPNGGKPLVVTYRDGKAAEVKPGTQESS
jgi:hypothetical protein